MLPPFLHSPADWEPPQNPGRFKKAIVAIAHTLLKIAYSVLKSGRPYQDPGADSYARRESPAQQQAYHQRQIQKLYPGCTVTVTITPPPSGTTGPPPDAGQPGAPPPPGHVPEAI